ncbi:MAG: DegV family protein [Dehalococcoidales bacterium]|nr:DegV family protein [Dehalococcoidales bacterium]
MKKVVVSSDSGTILPEAAQHYGFTMIPVPIIIDGETYLDTEINMDDLYARLDGKENLPKTSTANVAEFAQFFIDLARNADAILHISMSSVFSGHHSAALQGKELAIEKLPKTRIEIVDSLTMGTGVALIAIQAARAAAKGKSMDDVMKLVAGIIPQMKLFLARDTLFYQAEGGRIFEAKTWAEAEQATSFRSITEVDSSTGGALRPVARAKTVAQIMEKLVEITRESGKGGKLVGVIGHTRALERAEKLRGMLRAEIDFDWLEIAEESASAAIHTGKGLIGYGFCNKID